MHAPSPMDATPVTADETAAIMVGHADGRVVVSMDPARARRMASLIALMTTSPTRPVDRTVLDTTKAEMDEWMRAFIDLLSAAAFATHPVVSRMRLQYLPVRFGQQPSDLGHQGEVESRPTLPRAGLPTMTVTVRDGYLCSCGFVAIDRGPDTPTYAALIAEHEATCVHATSEDVVVDIVDLIQELANRGQQ